jgi:hypothetical protein
MSQGCDMHDETMRHATPDRVRVTLTNDDMNTIMSAFDCQRETWEYDYSGGEREELGWAYDRMRDVEEKIHSARRRMDGLAARS